ncbi:deoxyribonuclease gamma-like isoform X1 [Perca fluviatilis]|nr:deoxyribonuclease gamma-like isoform X1 [Perca fluviatilis]
MRWRSPCLPLLLFSLLALSLAGDEDFKICSYNVQGFNLDKSRDYRVLHTLTRIASRCDICLLLHVTDFDGKGIQALLDSLNRATDRYDGYTYQSVASKSLGPDPEDMQQYVFLYRTDTVNVTGQYQYQKPDSFVRPPFAVQFYSAKTAIKSFILIPLHSDPSRAVQEIDRLYDVFQEVSKKWSNKNVMLLGDFHAACAYVTRDDKRDIRLYTNSAFAWLIGDRVDTTVSEETNCAFDRIVVHGKTFLKAITPFSAQVYNYAEDLKIPRAKAVGISDHLPVEVDLKGSAPLLQATPLLILLSVSAVLQHFLSASVI